MKTPNSILLITCMLFVIVKTEFVDSFKLLRDKRHIDNSPVPSRCLYPPDSGMCMAYFENYYYNSATGKCETFVYGGCGGNDNNFWSLNDCQTVCEEGRELNEDSENDFHFLLESLEPLVESKDDCEYPPESGKCRARFLNYYFNGEKCEIFVYGGCNGNPNNFQTEEECIERCMPKSGNENEDSENDFHFLLESLEPVVESKDDCEYPPETGECRALFLNYYFNGEKCEIFVYGGCGGNPNNFQTEEDCIERCMPKPGNESEENNV